MIRLATAGESTASPRAVARTARKSSSRGESFSRYPVAHDWVIVGDQQLDRHGATPAGTFADTAVPPPGSDSMFSVPASRWMRCRIPGRPKPVASPVAGRFFDVGERFLGDPEQRRLDLGMQLAGVASGGELDSDPGALAPAPGDLVQRVRQLRRVQLLGLQGRYIEVSGRVAAWGHSEEDH
jgi:hypothetical protein